MEAALLTDRGYMVGEAAYGCSAFWGCNMQLGDRGALKQFMLLDEKIGAPWMTILPEIG